METLKTLKLLLTFLLALLVSCNSTPQFNEQDKIFQASGASGGIGGIYFALYKDHKYQICESGGLGEKCYSGTYSFLGDTIILNDLNKDCYVKSNRLLICRYNKLDSTYWKWKYPQLASEWKKMKESDLQMNTTGDVHQIDGDNKLILDPTYYFVIRLDSLKNNR